MSTESFREPEQLSGYTGDQEPAAEKCAGALPRRGGAAVEQNRGQLAPSSGSGDVIGSGASAGGGGGPEEYDTDPQAGGGKVEMSHPDSGSERGGDAPKHGSR